MANFIRWNSTTHIYELSTNDGISFVPLPLNASVINEGSFAKANLPATIAYEDEPNTFTQQQLIYGSNGPPSLTSSASAFLKILSDTTVHLDIGAQSGGLYPIWLQSKVNGQGSAYAMSLNPLGGRVGIGTLSPSTTLEVAGDATVTGNATVTGAGGNVACKNQSNVFTAGQNLTCANPIIDLFDTAQPANGRLFRFWNSNQWLLFDALNDNGSLVSRTYFNRGGDLFLYRDLYAPYNIYEKSRTTPIGHWIDFTPAGYSGLAITTNYACKYMLVGKTLTVSFYLGVNVVSGPPIGIFIPGGLVASANGAIPMLLDGGVGMAQSTPGANYIAMYATITGAAIATGARLVGTTFSFQVN